MDVEKVRMNVTLKAGFKSFLKGVILVRPFPREIIDEINQNTGTVEILSRISAETSPVKEQPPVEVSPIETVEAPSLIPPKEEVKIEKAPEPVKAIVKRKLSRRKIK